MWNSDTLTLIQSSNIKCLTIVHSLNTCRILEKKHNYCPCMFVIIYVSDCPSFSRLTNLPSSMSCSLDSSCTKVECCIYSKELDRTFLVASNINMCQIQLSLGIENLKRDFGLGLPAESQTIAFDLNNIINFGWDIIMYYKE